MFVRLNYNPEGKVYDYPGVEEVIETIRKYQGDRQAEYFKNLVWKDILSELSDGVYEFYDVNDPLINNISFREVEHITLELAEELCYDKKLFEFQKKFGNKEIYVHHPHGVCDNWEQIFEKVPEIENYRKSKEKFVIFLSCIRKEDQPKNDGWRWHKWGPYIGTKNPQYEYLRDEPDIEEVYVFHVSRIIENE